jgi:hypothetical protein
LFNLCCHRLWILGNGLPTFEKSSSLNRLSSRAMLGVTPEMAANNPNAGDIWLWVAIDANSKIVPAWHLGDRSAACAHAFMLDLASRLKNRVQLTSDGHKS